MLENLDLRAGLNVYRGPLTYKAVDESLGLFLLTDRTGCGMIPGTLPGRFLPDLGQSSEWHLLPAEYERQLGGGSPPPSLVAAKG